MKLKSLIILLIFVSKVSVAQTLKFETKFYDAVDKWVAFDKQQGDSAYTCGFIYIDSQAGFTFNFESRFYISNQGLVLLPKDEKSNLKVRLSKRTASVAVLSDNQIKQLNLPLKPDWLAVYKTNDTSVSYLTRIGYHYNHVGASENAISPLLRAYNSNPHFKGLEFELAYAYNATKEYLKAIEVLKSAINVDSTNFWFYRELGFSYIGVENLEKADEVYQLGLSKSNNKDQNAEMAINMTQAYYKIRDRKKFDKWVKITRDNISDGHKFHDYIRAFESNWEK